MTAAHLAMRQDCFVLGSSYSFAEKVNWNTAICVESGSSLNLAMALLNQVLSIQQPQWHATAKLAAVMLSCAHLAAML